jgi:alcohol dehydrogenase (cytochrome c)
MTIRLTLRFAAVMYVGLVAGRVEAQVTAERLLRAADEPRNWLTYSGTYDSHRHSTLSQITPQNVANLELKWVFQAKSNESFEATPLVVDGVMYVTQPPNDVVAIDARTGGVFWIYRHANGPDAKPCCGAVNRGLAILGRTLYMATLDNKLIALDAVDGQPLWSKEVADAKLGYTLTLAPLVIKNNVLIGGAGGEFGVRGFLAAYDAATGEERWRFYTIPGPGEPGHETWPANSNAWEHGGGPIWLTGSYDPVLNLTYWGTGNASPDFNAKERPGDNLYTSSVIALNPDTGKLVWHYQFSPNDDHDYDAVQIPVLVNGEWNGQPRKLMYWANRNGYFYTLDRATGEFLSGTPFVKVTWAKGFDAKGRPIKDPNPPDGITYPGVQGGTNWYSPSYSPRTGFFYMSVWEDYAAIFTPVDTTYKQGQVYIGGRIGNPVGQQAASVPFVRRSPINTWTEAAGHGTIIAFDPKTGARKWGYPMTDASTSGILTTATDLVFAGGREGYFHAFDARTGALLWKTPNLGGPNNHGPITYELDGKQYVVTQAGNGLYVFGLR